MSKSERFLLISLTSLILVLCGILIDHDVEYKRVDEVHAWTLEIMTRLSGMQNEEVIRENQAVRRHKELLKAIHERP